MGPRIGLSWVLLSAALVLLIGIALGNGMGRRVLGGVAARIPNLSTTPIPLTTPSSNASENPNSFAWKRREVISVATDPAFPDPRVTPEPTLPPTPRPPTPRPTAKATRPAVLPTEPPLQSTPTATSNYTSPPLLYPMGSRAPATTVASPAATAPVSSSPNTPPM